MNLKELGRHYNRRGFQIGKRIADVLLSAGGLVVLAPLFLLTAIALVVSDGFPIVFRHRRVGRDGKVFHIYKFRTMLRNAEEILRSRPDLMEEYKKYYKIQNDPRIHKVGHFLRKTSLDELPQLWNVLMGDMSLVGPRPIVEPELEKYGDYQGVYLAMKPGCAGLWQCSGRSDTTYDERVALDIEYCENASLWYDFGVMVKTLASIVRMKGAQ
jgi:lipopolysaccharide/colanic/teichoic acid biosynthesis glycosyltransferase